MSSEIVEGLQHIASERGIDFETLVSALEDALVQAYKKLPSSTEEARVSIASGAIVVYAQEVDEEGNVLREWEDTPSDFGRIAAQAAKQVLTQRLQAAERDKMYDEYHGREGEIVTGIVQQRDQRYTLLELSKGMEALLPQAEQVPYERYEQGARLKAYIVEVRRTAKGPQIVVSRTHPGLVYELFRLEVPEIDDGIVEVRAIAREPGARTKLAVASNDPNVDPVGACVGARGSRVRMVVNELRGEKVDIITYSGESDEYVAKALSPAKVREVKIDEETGTAVVIVPDFQLSLAIGKEGQNAKLAARLTGWRVDIRSETENAAPPPQARVEAEAAAPVAEAAAEVVEEAQEIADTADSAEADAEQAVVEAAEDVAAEAVEAEPAGEAAAEKEAEGDGGEAEEGAKE